MKQANQFPHPAPAILADVAVLTLADVCAAVRKGPTWVKAEIRAKRMPAPHYIGCSARWVAAEIRAYLVEQATQTDAASRRHAMSEKARGLSAAAAAARSARAPAAA